jgi:hypothetical protein
VLCFLLATPAFGWWETGHRTVARIAVFYLTPAARTRLARILNVPDTPNSVADALAIASTWADETKSQTKTGAWHFIDIALQDHESDIRARCQNDNCVTARIRIFAAQLSSHSPAAPGQPSDLDALRYLVHFVGDVHQPLHAVSDADLGGNCEHVDPPVGSAKNVHAVWDGPMVDSFNESDVQLAADLEKTIDSYTPKLRSDLALGNQDDWAWESHRVAIKQIYQNMKIPEEPIEFPADCTVAPRAITRLTFNLSQTYLDEMHPVVRDQLVKAGLRLARLLSESL